jgi:alpha-tubulin suppressor-like RCC1 family protein
MEYTQIYAWGGDHSGQMGLGREEYGKHYCNPHLYSFNVIIRGLSCGEKHTAFITDSGDVFTIGCNEDGRLGIGD